MCGPYVNSPRRKGDGVPAIAGPPPRPSSVLIIPYVSWSHDDSRDPRTRPSHRELHASRPQTRP
ncbi:protein of unknown function [Streptomyces murinus]